MAHETVQLVRGLVTLKVTDSLQESDIHAMRAAALSGIKEWGKIRILVSSRI
jgi:hypothetical protein